MNKKILLHTISLVLIIILAVILMRRTGNKDKKLEKISFHAIGYINTTFKSHKNTPGQGQLNPNTNGRILLDERYIPAIKTLGEFNHIIITYYFDQIEDWDKITTTPGSDKKRGLFATRSPNRPNPIGITVVKLDSIKDNMLYISGIDAFDGSPVLDIKPYIPKIDCVKNAITPENFY